MAIEHPSPGVFTRIFDLSEYVRTTPSTVGYVPILSDRGRHNELVLVNRESFFREFGEPNINYLNLGYRFNQGKYIADSFLKESDALYVVRVVADDASYSNLYLQRSGSTITTATDSPITNKNSFESPIDAGTYVAGFRGKGIGDRYNDFKIDITRPGNTELSRSDVYLLDVYKKQVSDNTKTFVNAINSASDSTSDVYSIVETFEVSFNPDDLDPSGESRFIENVINNFSSHISCYANREELTTDLGSGQYVYDGDYVNFASPFSSAVALQSGSDGAFAPASGYSLTERQAAVTTELMKAYDGTLETPDSVSGSEINLSSTLFDKDSVYISVVFDAGYPQVVKDKAIDMSKIHRKDCVTIFDNNDNKSYTQAITTVSGNSTSASRGYKSSVNTMYAARYEGWGKVFDEFTGGYIWLSPVYGMARVIPYNDSVGEVWFAPAGFNRGTVSEFEEIRFNPSLAERDEFYLKQINPIVNFSIGGHTVFGQLTSQTKPSALQDLNVVRLVLYIQRALERFARDYIFEQNDETTWNAINSAVNGFLKEIQNKRGLSRFNVSVGASDYEQKLKRIHVNVTLQPIKAAEQILLNFYIE